jgi:membrane protein
MVTLFLKRLGRTFWQASTDGCLGCAKGAAYSALLSIFPVLSSLTAILAQANAERLAQTLARLLFEVTPDGAEGLLRHTLTARGAKPIYLLIGAGLLSAIAASEVMLSLMDGFQAAFRVRTSRGFWRQRMVATALVFAAALPALAASAFVIYTGGAFSYVPAVVAVAMATMLLYRFGPDLPDHLMRTPVWPGALIATALWVISTVLFVAYVRYMANYNIIYGSIGAVVALMVWLYLLMASALMGCEYNAERLREEVYPGKLEPPA